MKTKVLAAAAALSAIAAGGAAWAHHSFAVFFDETRTVRVEGTVTSFRFTNPHALVVMNVTQPNGQTVEWRAETNAPVVLQRRGWNRSSLHAGDRIIMDGWPSRDGRNYMRLRSARSAADNRLIGSAPFSTGDE
ncbi:DUF6152 family protein [Alteraurantiacibacter buctensis]|uniref:DUF5666 domain-containing protein n=1 Tax=Alteraurantiacibacter buctensis TaxID=1503981 RepID=A0A844Z055_9SPHN|nr:hypothetical protein [Alteraurantiacibacter buctensis]